MFGKKGSVSQVPVNGLSMSVEVAVSEVDDRTIGWDLNSNESRMRSILRSILRV
jgi:hypothetical protein